MQITVRIANKKKDRPNKQGYPIYFDVTWQHNQQYLYTGEKCWEQNFINDTKKMKFVSDKQAYHFDINNKLVFLHNEVHRIFKEAFEQGFKVSPAYLKAEFHKSRYPQPKPIVKEKINTYQEISDKYTLFLANGEPEKVKKSNYLRVFRQIYPYMNDLCEGTPPIEKIDYLLLQEFVNHCFDEELSNNSINSHIKKIKTVLAYAENTLKLKVDTSYQHFSHEYIDPEIIFLLPEELRAWENVKLSDELLAEARDFYAFGCYIGARHSDLKVFTSENIVRTGNEFYLKYRPKKNPKLIVTVPIMKKALAILERYQGKFTTLIKPFANDEINLLIKEIGKKAGIKNNTFIVEWKKNKMEETTYKKYERITMHTSRHTFATLNAMGGMEKSTLHKLLGHKNPIMTEKYIHIAEGYKTEQMKRIWG